MEQQTTVTDRPALKIPSTLKSLIEGLIFAASEPLTVRQIKAILEQQNAEGEERQVDQSEIQRIVAELNQEYQKADKAYRIIAIAGGFQFATMKEYAEWIGRLSREQARRKLSQSSLESLAIIAYKQPVTKPEIELIRGVNCDYVLKTLLEKELVTIVGRAETVGRPLLYGTTREFLKHFGLNEVTDLPRPREIEEILGESQFETERRMLEAAAGAEEMKREEEDFKSRLPHIPKKKAELDEEVKIVPKARRRKIAVRTGDEVEPPAQESVKPEPGTPPRASELEDRAEQPPPPEPIPEVEEPRPADTESKAGMSLVDLEEASVTAGQARSPKTVRAAAVTAESPADLHIQRNTIRSGSDETGPAPEQPSHEPEMSQPRRSRWTSWKEKIQIFIKKLFV